MRVHPAPSRDDARHRMLVLCAIFHACIVMLGITGRLSFTVRARYDTLQALAESPLWLWMHAAAAILLTAAAQLGALREWALSFSVCVVGPWAFLTFLWGLYPLRPVSLLGPVVCAVWTIATWSLIGAYIDAEVDAGDDPDRR